MKKHNFVRIAGIFVMISLLVGVAFTNISCAKKQKVIKIGAILPLTGTAGKYGQYIRQALELAREEINKQGGINGKSLEIIYEDDQAEPKLAATAMSKLVEFDKVPIVFGSWASSCVLAEAPIAEKTHTPILAEAQSPKIRDAGDYVFRIQPDSRYYLKFLVPYVYKNLNIRKIAILYVNNDYGMDQAFIFKKSFEKLGGQVVYMEGFPQGATEFRDLLHKVNRINPQGIFIPAYTEAAYILKQAYEIGLKTQFIGSAPLENPEIIKIAGMGAEGAIYPHHFDPESENPKVKEFIHKYREKYHEDPEGYAPLAYDGLYIIADVLKKCGTNRECIKKALYKVQNFPGVTGSTSFDDHGDVVKPIYIRGIRGGKFVTLWRPSQ